MSRSVSKLFCHIKVSSSPLAIEPGKSVWSFSQCCKEGYTESKEGKDARGGKDDRGGNEVAWL